MNTTSHTSTRQTAIAWALSSHPSYHILISTALSHALSYVLLNYVSDKERVPESFHYNHRQVYITQSGLSVYFMQNMLFGFGILIHLTVLIIYQMDLKDFSLLTEIGSSSRTQLVWYAVQALAELLALAVTYRKCSRLTHDTTTANKSRLGRCYRGNFGIGWDSDQRTHPQRQVAECRIPHRRGFLPRYLCLHRLLGTAPGRRR